MTGVAALLWFWCGLGLRVGLCELAFVVGSESMDTGSALGEYRAVQDRVDAFFDVVLQRREPEAMRCASGCDQCCHVELSLSAIEAMQVRDHLEANPEIADSLQSRQAVAGRCRMLSERGQCDIYEARPLVCRSQGLPLLYPHGIIPVEAIMGRGLDKSGGSPGDITWCPLNFQNPSSAPIRSEVLDAATIDKMHSLINAKWCKAQKVDRLHRASFEQILATLL